MVLGGTQWEYLVAAGDVSPCETAGGGESVFCRFTLFLWNWESRGIGFGVGYGGDPPT